MSAARLLLLLLMCMAAPAQAGRGCQAQEPSPQAWAAAADTALRVLETLESADAPIALLSRAGTDLSAHGLHYSHLGFALRDHPAGRWTVVHLLNYCDSDRSALYAEGLLPFFADDLARQDARISWLQPALAEALAARLLAGAGQALHQPRYNLIARPGSPRTQNSTAWALEMLAAAELPGRVDRRSAQAWLQAQGFAPDEVRIAYTRRIAGGLFAANLDFNDHPVSTRLGGRYPVVSVRAILRYLQAGGRIAREWEWREGRVQKPPGAA
ncbi:MAG: DUF2145 domain-containing protein [Aquimonas sp.]|nr:DUF2145 domain-containing protein [Aquimonas sp.]